MRAWPLLGASLLLACDSPPLMRPAAPSAGAPLAVASGAPGAAAQKLLFTAATAATAAGAGALSVVAAELAAEGDRVGAFVEPPEGACLLAVARGAEGVDDVDLLSFNDEGTPLAVDEATDPSPALLLCPPHPGRVYLMARVMSGRGLVAVGALPVPLTAALRVGKALNARGRPGASGREAEAWPGLDEKSAALRRGVGGQWREVRRAAVPAEARAPGHLTEPIEAGRCLLIQATPSDETSDIDAQILDAEGRSLARASEVGRDRAAIVCASTPTSVSVELRPRIGAGVAAVVLSRSVAGSEADISARIERVDAFPVGTADEALARLGARLKAAGYGAPAGRAQGAARANQKSTAAVTLPPGCARVDVVGGAPLAGLVAELWSEQGQLWGRGEGGGAAPLFACGPGGRARLEVEAQLRPGPFSVEVRSEGADAALAGLAGGRLLSRLNASGDIVRAAALQGAQRVQLTPQAAGQAHFRVPEGRCLEVGAALGPGGAGVELRLLDGTSRDELAQGAAAWATAARVCVVNATDLSAEVRLSSGKAEAIVAGRLVGSPP